MGRVVSGGYYPLTTLPPPGHSRALPLAQGESFKKVGSTVESMRASGVFASSLGAFQAMATPAKLPLESFNEWYLQPYSAHRPVSLAELSALNATAGPPPPHGECFGMVALVKTGSGMGIRAFLNAAERVKAHFLPQAPPSPWRTKPPEGGENGTTTRVLIEMRPHAAARQFLETDEARPRPQRRTALRCIQRSGRPSCCFLRKRR